MSSAIYTIFEDIAGFAYHVDKRQHGNLSEAKKSARLHKKCMSSTLQIERDGVIVARLDVGHGVWLEDISDCEKHS